MQLTLENLGYEVGNVDYPNSTYLVVSKVGYLLGVPKRYFEQGQLQMEYY